MSAPTHCHLEIFQYNDGAQPAAEVTFDKQGVNHSLGLIGGRKGSSGQATQTAS